MTAAERVERRDAHAPLREQFDDLRQQLQASTIGMWLFLATEVLFFGTLFVGYTLYRSAHQAGFAAASRETSLALGTANTAVLLTSSVTMAMAVHAAHAGRRRAVAAWLGLTMVLGIAFLTVKGIEYGEEIGKGLFPGPGFAFAAGLRPTAHLFFSFYFVMTALHALHLVIGISLVGWVARRAWRGDFSADWSAPVDVTGLYWHFVDVVWIFLYPLLYLVGRR